MRAFAQLYEIICVNQNWGRSKIQKYYVPNFDLLCPKSENTLSLFEFTRKKPFKTGIFRKNRYNIKIFWAFIACFGALYEVKMG